MGRFAVITLTDAAANRVHEIMTSREDALGIRVGVKRAAVQVWNIRSNSSPRQKPATT